MWGDRECPDFLRNHLRNRPQSYHRSSSAHYRSNGTSSNAGRTPTDFSSRPGSAGFRGVPSFAWGNGPVKPVSFATLAAARGREEVGASAQQHYAAAASSSHVGGPSSHVGGPSSHGGPVAGGGSAVSSSNENQRGSGGSNENQRPGTANRQREDENVPWWERLTTTKTGNFRQAGGDMRSTREAMDLQTREDRLKNRSTAQLQPAENQERREYVSPRPTVGLQRPKINRPTSANLYSKNMRIF